MSDRIILETNGKRYVAKDFVGPLEYFNESIQVTDGLCCPNCGCPRTWIPVKELPMADTKNNALAELAEDLRVMGLDVDGTENEILDKAQRIIEELAKVMPRYLAGKAGHSFIDTEAYKAYRNCRAIAKEEQTMASENETVYAALSTPSRNCDVLSKDEALEVLNDRSFSKEDTIEWLYAEAKRGAK